MYVVCSVCALYVLCVVCLVCMCALLALIVVALENGGRGGCQGAGWGLVEADWGLMGV